MRRNESMLLPSYIGSKFNHVKRVSAVADTSCDTLIEPFCGSAAVTMLTPVCRYKKYIINDMNCNISFLYEAMRRESTRDRMVEELLKINKSDDEIAARNQFNNAAKQLLPTGKVELSQIEDEELIKVGVNTYIAYTQSFNSNSTNYTTYKTQSKYARDSAVRINNSKAKFGELQEKLEVTCDDGLEIIERFKNCRNVQMYIDPPYVGLYRLCNKLYRQEMPLLINHIKLAMALKDAKCAVILSGYRAPDNNVPTIYDAILTGDKWHCFKLADTFNKCKNAKFGENKKRCTEYIWTNRVPKFASFDLSMKDYKESLSFDEYWVKIAELCKTGKISKKHMKEYKMTYHMLCGKELYEEKEEKYEG